MEHEDYGLKLGGYYRLQIESPVWVYDSDTGLTVPEYEERYDSGWQGNTITTAGIAAVASRINGSGAEAVFNYIAVATSATAIVIGDTALTSEITGNGLARKIATVSRTGTNNEKSTWTASWTAGGSETIGSMGIFNASSAGVMISGNGGYSQAVVTLDVVNATYTIPLA